MKVTDSVETALTASSRIVPNGWILAPFKWAVKQHFSGDWGSDPEASEIVVNCVRVADFDRDFGTVSSNVPTRRSYTNRSWRSRHLQTNDLLLEKSGGTPKNPVGRVALYTGMPGLMFSNFIHCIRLLDGHDPRFWHYTFLAAYATRFTNVHVRQTTGIQNLDMSGFLDEKFTFPNLPLQHRIADYLDRETAQIDAMAGALDGLVARLEERRRGLFKIAVGDSRQASLAVIAGITLGKMLDLNKNKGTPTPYIRAANVKRTGIIDVDDLKLMKVTPAETATYSLNSDDIVMVEGGDAGRVGYVNFDLPGIAFQKTVMRIRCYPESAFPRYVYYALDDAHKSGRVSLDYSLSTIPHFPAEKAARLEIPLPPLSEQRRIAEHLDAETAKIDAMIAKANELRALLDERRSALITAVVTGQRPVPEEL